MLLVGIAMIGMTMSSVSATCTSQCNAGGLSGCKNWDSEKFPTTTYDTYTIELDGKTYYYTDYFDNMGDAITAVKNKGYSATKPPASYNRPDDCTRGLGWWRFDRYQSLWLSQVGALNTQGPEPNPQVPFYSNYNKGMVGNPIYAADVAYWHYHLSFKDIRFLT